MTQEPSTTGEHPEAPIPPEATTTSGTAWAAPSAPPAVAEPWGPAPSPSAPEQAGGWGPPPPPTQAGGWGPPPPPTQTGGWAQHPAQPGWGEAPVWGGVTPGAMVPGGWAGARPKPGIIPLRPVVMGEIFDGSFQAIRTNPRTMMGLSAIVLAVVTLVAAAPQAAVLVSASRLLEEAATPADLVPFTTQVLQASSIKLLLTLIAAEIVTAMLVVAVSGAVLGQRLGPGEVWHRVRSRVPAVLGLALLTTLAVVGVIILLAVPSVLGFVLVGRGVGSVLLGLGMLAGVVVAALLTVRWAFAGPVLLLEEQGVVSSLRRSWQLVRGSTWRVLGIVLLTQVIVGIGSTAISFPFAMITGLVSSSSATPYASFWGNVTELLVQGVGEVLAGAVFYPFGAAAVALLYIDVRMRREGLDVELMRAAESGPSA